MEHDQDPPCTNKDPEALPHRVRPWMRKRVRLTVLLTCLGLAGLGLVKSKTDILSGDSGVPRGAASACAASKLPRVANVGLDQLLKLRASLLPIVESFGGRSEPSGVTTPEHIWLEGAPQTLRISRLPGGYWPGGYEMRQRSRDGEEVVADAFLFAHPSQSRKYLGLATNLRCHEATTLSATSRPPEARNLVSLGRQELTSYRVILIRGQRAYRVVVLRPWRSGTEPSRAERNAGSSMVDDLACRLAVANCATKV